MRFELAVDVPFDVLDAAVHECLPGYAPAGWVEFERREITPASVEYDMFLTSHGDLGDLGKILVRKTGSATSVMDFRDPERPRPRQLTKEESEKYDFGQYSKEESISRQLQVLKELRQEAKQLFRRRRNHQQRVIQALFSRLSTDTATQVAFSSKSPPEETDTDPVEDARAELRDFCSLVERQLHADIFDGGRPQERFARSLLQAFTSNRSYREVQVRGGRSDLLAQLPHGRILYETKIWRGKKSYQAGLAEIEEYIRGENSDGNLLTAFYVVFDPTISTQAVSHLGSKELVTDVRGFPVEVFVVSMALEAPSKRGFA